MSTPPFRNSSRAPTGCRVVDGGEQIAEWIDRTDAGFALQRDGPPHEQDLIEMSVIVAGAVLIPVKPAYFDTSVIDSIVGMCKRRQKPYAFVISEWDDRKAFANANNIALAMLEGRGPVLGTRISYHPKYRVGQIDGMTGAELDKGLSKEIDTVWTEAKRLAGIGSALKKMEGGRG
jgi:cellulose biosynthesis protein BcsQ